MRQQRVQRGGQTADDHGKGQVFHGVIMHQRIGAAQQIHKGPGEEPRAQRIQNRYRGAAPEGEGGRILGPLQIPCAQSPGNHTGAAYAEQVGNRLQKHKGGHADRSGGNHGIAAGQADKKRVGHIVQNQNDLADHRGKSQTDDRLQHGAVLKQRFFSFFHNPVPPFLKIWKKERRPRTNAAAAAIALTPFPDGIGEQASSPLTAARFFRFVCQQKQHGVASHLRHVLSFK